MIKESSVRKQPRDDVTAEMIIEMVQKEVDKVLSTSPMIVRSYMEHLGKTTGKCIRGVSLITCAIRSDGSIHRDAVRLAGAVELIHLATLVHDDIIDDAELRRGELSLQKKYGKRTAVICGDYLLCAALALAEKSDDRERYQKIELPRYLGKVVLGELYQHLNNGNLNLSVRKYLKIISGKTGALFKASYIAGATLSETDERVIRQYAKLGHYTGMIFQLTDDCMDFETTEYVAKKPVQADFKQNVITLPLIRAFQTQEGLRQKAEKSKLSQREIDEAISRSKGLSYTRLLGKRYHVKAEETIKGLPVSDAKRERLEAILKMAYREF